MPYRSCYKTIPRCVRAEIEDEQLSQPAFALAHSQRADRLNVSCAEMRYLDERRLLVARVSARPPPSARGLDKLTYRLTKGSRSALHSFCAGRVYSSICVSI